jgi:MFS transporter, UMF1 family
MAETAAEERPAIAGGERRIPRRAITSWVLYDLANTVFSMGVVSLYLPLWLREQLGAETADTTFGVITAVSYALIFFVSPQLGAMTDRLGRRMPFLVVSTLICVGFTALLARFDVMTTAILFVAANIAYSAGLQFYDALLPEVSTEENRGWIGGIGIGVGYLGAFFAVSLGFVVGRDDKPLLFLLVAALFLLFALPCFLFVRERPRRRRDPVFGWRAMRESTMETWRTLRSGKEYPGLLRFLIGRVFYTDAINTVIIVMALVAVNVAVATGLSEDEGEAASQFVLLFSIVFAVIGGFVWGRVTDRLGPKRTLNIVLFLWMGTFTFGAIVSIVALPIIYLYAVGALAGFAIGGVWSSDRPYMLRLTPPHRIGEFYGLYGMVGRFAAITGPATWALIFWLTVRVLGLEPRVGQGLGILTLVAQMFVAYLILRRVSDAPRHWPTTEEPPGPAAELRVAATPRLE